MNTPSPSFSDIPEKGLVARLPARLRPYARLMRLDRPIGTWLLLLPCLWGTVLAGGFQARSFLLFACGAIVMRGAGCILNDLFDRRLDRAVKRTVSRPLASGAVGLWGALGLLALLLLCGLGLLLCFSYPAILLGMASLPLVVLYPLSKRAFGAPQLVLGFVFNWGALLGWIETRGTLGWPAVALYAAGIFWTLAYDTLYAFQDREDDAKMGMGSLALTLPAPSVKRWIGGFFGGALALFALAGLETGLGYGFFLSLAAALLHAFWQVAGWDPTSPASGMTRFRSNRDFGLILLAGLLLGRLF